MCGATCRTPPIPWSALEKDPRPGPLLEGNPVGEGKTRRGTATPGRRPQRPAGSTHSSTRGLRPHEQLERPAGFPSSDKTRPDSPVPTLQGPCGRSPKRRGSLRFLPPLEVRPSSVLPDPAESRLAPPPPQDRSPLRGTLASSLRSPAEGEGNVNPSSWSHPLRSSHADARRAERCSGALTSLTRVGDAHAGAAGLQDGRAGQGVLVFIQDRRHGARPLGPPSQGLQQGSPQGSPSPRIGSCDSPASTGI